MSISKRVYDIFKVLNQSDLVLYKNVNNETLAEFEKLLNESQPNNENERAQRYMLKSLYFSNPINFMRYLCDSQNRINALILWTESKYIVKYFNLQNKIYLLWDSSSSSYKVSKYLPLTQRTQKLEEKSEQKTNSEPVNTSETTPETNSETTSETKPEPRLLNKKFRKFKKFNLVDKSDSTEYVQKPKEIFAEDTTNTTNTTSTLTVNTSTVNTSNTQDNTEFKSKSWADIVN